MLKTIFASVLALGLTVGAANADPLSVLQGASLKDVKQAEAIYAANPQVPTYQAATQCLTWADGVLSSPNAPITLGVLPPEGVVSGIADLDVALTTTGTVPPIVDDFNKNCGWYVEDLKAAAAAHASGNFVLFGLKL
jgi:hypothetical protein